MSISSIEIIMNRIKVATNKSPLVVFRHKKGFDAVFGSTVDTQIRLNRYDPDLVGVFNRNMDKEQIENVLYETENHR